MIVFFLLLIRWRYKRFEIHKRECGERHSNEAERSHIRKELTNHTQFHKRACGGHKQGRQKRVRAIIVHGVIVHTHLRGRRTKLRQSLCLCSRHTILTKIVGIFCCACIVTKFVQLREEQVANRIFRLLQHVVVFVDFPFRAGRTKYVGNIFHRRHKQFMIIAKRVINAFVHRQCAVTTEKHFLLFIAYIREPRTIKIFAHKTFDF
mmetsp:Transcript_1196/g.2335  ORF Transcript_1196/g.2335 Transcript_1196/m.2335 type:complete len:206 (-) Transcript_1196:1282-1899(-)